jgi:hypothetical protein
VLLGEALFEFTEANAYVGVLSGFHAQLHHCPRRPEPGVGRAGRLHQLNHGPNCFGASSGQLISCSHLQLVTEAAQSSPEGRILEPAPDRTDVNACLGRGLVGGGSA